MTFVDRGFEAGFTHSTGHGVGFGAIDANVQPQLHPAASGQLRTDTVCNVEPAIYVQDFGGSGIIDMVAVTATGCELLTNFQCHPQELVLNDR